MEKHPQSPKKGFLDRRWWLLLSLGSVDGHLINEPGSLDRDLNIEVLTRMGFTNLVSTLALLDGWG